MKFTEKGMMSMNKYALVEKNIISVINSIKNGWNSIQDEDRQKHSDNGKLTWNGGLS